VSGRGTEMPTNSDRPVTVRLDELNGMALHV